MRCVYFVSADTPHRFNFETKLSRVIRSMCETNASRYREYSVAMDALVGKQIKLHPTSELHASVTTLRFPFGSAGPTTEIENANHDRSFGVNSARCKPDVGR
jgi:hypothetical protein